MAKMYCDRHKMRVKGCMECAVVYNAYLKPYGLARSAAEAELKKRYWDEYHRYLDALIGTSNNRKNKATKILKEEHYIEYLEILEVKRVEQGLSHRKGVR